MTSDEHMKLIDDRGISDFLDLHLEVLSCVLTGMPFDEIQVKFSDRFQLLDYVEVAHFTSLLSFDDEGKLRGAYPFSPVETDHRVTVEGMGSGYAMWAIDALGVADLFGARTAIRSKDALTQTPIEIVVDPEEFDVEPYSNIFVIAPKGLPEKEEEEVYDSAIDSCPFVGFLNNAESISEDLRSRVTVTPLDLATEYGRSIFSRSAFADQIRAAILPLVEIYEAGTLPVDPVLNGILKRQTNPRLRDAPTKDARRLAINELMSKGVVQYDGGEEQQAEQMKLTAKGLRIVRAFVTEHSI